MSPFYLSSDADRDLDEIKLYLDTVPSGPADRILAHVGMMLLRIADNPHIGMAHSDLTRIAKQEVRSRLCGVYRIYYRMGHQFPEVFAIRHTARDSHKILANRLQ